MIKNIQFKAFIQVYLMKSFPNRHDIVYLGIGNEDGQMLLYTQLPENRRTYDFCNRTFQHVKNFIDCFNSYLNIYGDVTADGNSLY